MQDEINQNQPEPVSEPGSEAQKTPEVKPRPKIIVPHKMKIGEKFKMIRENKFREKQEVFAQRLGIKQSYLSKIERGEVELTAEKVKEFARKLNLEIHEILVDTESPIIKEFEPNQIAVCLNVLCFDSTTHIKDSDTTEKKWETYKTFSWYFLPRVDSDGEPNNYCDKCGSRLISECPHCKKPIKLNQPDRILIELFCNRCGGLILPYSYHNQGILSCMTKEHIFELLATIALLRKIEPADYLFIDNIMHPFDYELNKKTIENLLSKTRNTRQFQDFMNWWREYEKLNNF